MHPAPSVIVFTVLSGLGFGLLFFLTLGVVRPAGLGAFAAFGMGYALAVAGLVASTFHLGHPERALLAFTQWRTSWLSREAWARLCGAAGAGAGGAGSAGRNGTGGAGTGGGGAVPWDGLLHLDDLCAA